jgi:hypothetical protein
MGFERHKYKESWAETAYMRLQSNLFTLDSNAVRFLGMGDDVEDEWYPPNVSLGHPLN